MSSELLKTLEQDLVELKKLLEQAGRKRSQDLINAEILKVTSEINAVNSRNSILWKLNAFQGKNQA